MTINSLLTFVYVLLLIGTGGIVASYCPDENTRYRARVSIGAAAFAGSCFAIAAWTATNWSSACEGLTPRVLHTIFAACIFVSVARTRGNVAKLLPRLKWNHHS